MNSSIREPWRHPVHGICGTIPPCPICRDGLSSSPTSPAKSRRSTWVRPPGCPLFRDGSARGCERASHRPPYAPCSRRSTVGCWSTSASSSPRLPGKNAHSASSMTRRPSLASSRAASSAPRLQPQDLAYERPHLPAASSPPRRQRRSAHRRKPGHLRLRLRALRQAPGPLAAIAFGNGWEAAQAEPVIALADHLQLRAAPERIIYAGDLDIDGLDIPQTLAANLYALGFPEPQPLHTAYHAMLDPSRDRTGRPNAPAPEELALQAVTWLQDNQRDRAHHLLVSGQRVAQEVLDRTWWMTAEL